MTSTATATSTDTHSVVPHDERIKWVTSLPFFGVHAMALFAFVVPFKWQYLATCVGLYYFRMWALTTGYHRYFSHRTSRLGASSNSSSPSAPACVRKRGHCGGQRTTG